MKNSRTILSKTRVVDRILPPICAFLATLLALPVNAGITLPTDPLTTASRVPPNILFILDDSGSMAWRYMYNPDITSISGGNISSNPTGDNRSRDNSYDSTSTSSSAFYDQNYVTNTLYYNPKLNYQPWLDSSGNPLTGGTSYSAAYSSAYYVANIAANTTSSTTDLGGDIQTFYVPKENATNLSDARQYYRYQIRNGSTGRIVRSERLEATTTSTRITGTLTSGTGASANRYAPGNSSYTVTLPAGASNLVISSSGGTCNSSSGQCANLYVRRGNDPTTGNTNNGCRSESRGNNESCSPGSTSGGSTYYVRLFAVDTFSGVAISYSYDQQTVSNVGEEDVGCDTSSSGWGWRNCTYATPLNGDGQQRTEEAEKINFATWYSYYRTRTKAAKGGAAAAFGDLGTDVRVGFRTIHGRNGSDTSNNSPTQDVPIPVNYNQGLFANPDGPTGTSNNRARWYNRLYSATASSGTPLRTALDSAGQYFSNDAATGAYGPQSGRDQLQCRQNFTILTTDGYWNDDFSGVGDQDGSDGDEIEGPGGRTYQYEATTPYSDSASNTLADVAMKYWKTDLRTDMENIVPSTGANPAFWQHMVTFGISIGLKGTLDPHTALPGITAGTVSWPTPSADNLRTIDDLWHASVNGHGRFLAASNPTEFATGLRAALATVTERTGSFSNVAANSASLETDTLLFKASYVSGVWTGQVSAYPRQTGGAFTADASWNASNGIPTTNRRLFTSDGNQGLVFPSEATEQQVAALTRTGGASNYPVTGTDNAAYLAGDRRLELDHSGGTLRIRNHLLGDIVTSSPAYVKDTNTLYVGANDGMLHAINASNGSELFGFIPNGVNWSDLGTLSRPDYSHRYFVDGPIVVSTRTQTPNQNILVGTLGKGGKGIFALDVSNPASFDSDHFKWEIKADDDITTTGDNNLGLVQGRPFIAKLNNGVTAVIIGNGINSTNGHAVLQIYDLNSGELIRELDTGVGSPLPDHSNSNGLSAPIGWNRDGNDTYDYVYAGDMLGNVWKFDLTSATPGQWGVANSGSPLFTAVGPDGSTRQPITGGLAIARHPTSYKTWVFFGTGRFLTAGDVNSQAVQTLYGITDSGSTVAKSSLTQRAIELTATESGQLVRAFEQHDSLPVSSSGWYVNLVDPAPVGAIGERIVTSPQMDGSVLEVSSIIPTADACQPDGRGYLNALDAFTGTSTSTPYFDVNRNNNFNDDTIGGGGGSNPASRPIGSVDLGVGMVTQATMFSGEPGRVCAAGSSGTMGCVAKDEFRNVGRVSWREVIRN